MKVNYSVENLIQHFVLGGCFLVTVFIFLNSYETVFGKDIKYINAVEIITIDSIITSIIQQDDNICTEDSVNMIENYGIPAYLKIPTNATNVQLMKAIKNSNNKLLCRSNSGHYIFFSCNEGKDSENIIIYIKKDWRTIDAINALKIGDNIFIETINDKMHMYKIDNIRKVSIDNQYKIVDKEKNPSLTIIIEDDNDVSYIIKTTFVSSQHIENE